jgi:hypothetical protein
MERKKMGIVSAALQQTNKRTIPFGFPSNWAIKSEKDEVDIHSISGSSRGDYLKQSKKAKAIWIEKRQKGAEFSDKSSMSVSVKDREFKLKFLKTSPYPEIPSSQPIKAEATKRDKLISQVCSAVERVKLEKDDSTYQGYTIKILPQNERVVSATTQNFQLVTVTEVPAGFITVDQYEPTTSGKICLNSDNFQTKRPSGFGFAGF